MASPNTARIAPIIPSDGPHAKFVRYARAVAKEHQPLFPLTPSTRPMVVGLDLRTLGPEPADYENLVHVLRRDVVTPMLMVFEDDDAALATAWIEACEVEEHHVLHYTNPQSVGRFLDSVEFSVSTMHGEERRGWRKCHFFDIYALFDAQDATATDLSTDDRIRAAVLASAGYGLGTDVVVSLAPTVGRADVGDNDIVTAVTPDDLHPVFGHYLRMTGNRTVAEYRYGGPSVSVTEKMEPPSMKKVYGIGLGSLVGWLDMFHIVAGQLGDIRAFAEIETVRTRIRRAARALDEVIAALSRTNGHDAAPTTDTIEFVSEAFDREMLYLMAVFDGYGRAFVRWLDPSSGRELRKSLHSAKTLDDYVDPYYLDAPQLARLRELQRFAFACSQLRNRIHDAVLPTGSFTNRTYGNSQSIAIDLGQTDVELTQELVDRLGVWRATPPNTVFGQPTTVAEVATTAVELFKASLEYVDLFTHLIMCTKPVGAPNSTDLLGKVTDTGYRPSAPHPTEALYRQLFRWD
ncbi:hypothetical protein HNP40_003456 [Mycobacteroides chelonae]|nr:hypothetical protein [Mycobacteroides chelonae]